MNSNINMQNLKINNQIDSENEFTFEKNPLMKMKNASDNLKNNWKFVYNAIDKKAECFVYASERLKDNIYLAYNAVSRNALLFQYCSLHLRNNELLAKLAAGQNIQYLSYIGEELKKNKSFFSQILENFGDKCLIYAHDSIKNELKKHQSS